MTFVPVAFSRRASRRVRGLAAVAVGGLVTTTSMVGAGLLGAPAHAVSACVPTVDRPSLVVADTPAVVGGTVTVTGAGFCHPTDGGSSVALKIDDGAYSRLDDSVHVNRTIWTIVEASATDGTFTVDVQLPNGTLGTSTPVFGEGTHFLRGLTGSIKAGDEGRTVKSNDFTVGEHRPSVAPEVMGEDELDAEAQDSFSVTGGEAPGEALRVSLPDGEEGDWVYPTLMLADGSPASPWGEWFRLGPDRTLELPTDDLDVSGRHRIVLQNGNAGEMGELVGWRWVTLPGEEPVVEPPVKQPEEQPGKKPKGDEPDKKPGKKSDSPKGDNSDDDVPQGGTGGGTGDNLPVAPEPVPAPILPAAPAVPVALPASVPASDVVAAVGPAAVVAPAVRPATLPSLYRGWSSMPQDAELAAELDGDTLAVQLGAGQSEAYVHLLDKAGNQVAAGWVDADSSGTALLDLRDLSDGGYRFSFQTATGLPIGWAALDLQGADIKGLRSFTDATAIAGVGERDLWLGGIGLTLLLGVGLGAVITRPRQIPGAR